MMRGYVVKTIGGIGDLPAGWVPAGTPAALEGQEPPVPGPPRPLSSEESISGPAIALVAVGGVLLGALGFWALKRWT